VTVLCNAHRRLIGSGLLIALCCSPARAEEANLSRSATVVRDRELEQVFSGVHEAIDNEQWGDAADRLQSVLDRPEGGVVSDHGTLRSARAVAEEILQSLPREGRLAYRRHGSNPKGRISESICCVFARPMSQVLLGQRSVAAARTQASRAPSVAPLRRRNTKTKVDASLEPTWTMPTASRKQGHRSQSASQLLGQKDTSP
jgi:hypothetical protein